MERKSITRDDVIKFKTLGLLGDIFKQAMKMKKEGITLLPLHLGDPPRFDFPLLPSFREGIAKALEIDDSSFAAPTCDINKESGSEPRVEITLTHRP